MPCRAVPCRCHAGDYHSVSQQHHITTLQVSYRSHGTQPNRLGMQRGQPRSASTATQVPRYYCRGACREFYWLHSMCGAIARLTRSVHMLWSVCAVLCCVCIPVSGELPVAGSLAKDRTSAVRSLQPAQIQRQGPSAAVSHSQRWFRYRRGVDAPDDAAADTAILH